MLFAMANAPANSRIRIILSGILEIPTSYFGVTVDGDDEPCVGTKQRIGLFEMETTLAVLGQRRRYLA